MCVCLKIRGYRCSVMWGGARRKCCFHVDRTYPILSVYVCDLECMSQSSSMIYTETLKHVWSCWSRGSAFLKLNSSLEPRRSVSKRLHPLHPSLFLPFSISLPQWLHLFTRSIFSPSCMAFRCLYLSSALVLYPLLFHFFSSHPQFPVLCSLSHVLVFRSSMFFFFFTSPCLSAPDQL